MNKEITIIELINKIANREEVPQKIKYIDKIYIYTEENQDYLDTEDEFYLLGYTFGNLSTRDFINDKVEILEEDKDIELLNLDTDKLKGKEVIRAIDYLLEGRINELVKEVNKLRKDNNNG